MSPTGTDLRQPAADLIDAFNHAYWTRLRAIVTADVVYNEIGTGRRIEGVDAYVEALEAWKQAFPDASGMILATIASDDTVAQRIRWRGTHTGRLPTPAGTIEATGKRVSVEASAWHRFEGDAISEIHHYLDVVALLQQIGALPR